MEQLFSDILLKNLKECLVKNRYSRISALPLRKYRCCRGLILNEGFNVFRFFLGRGNTFGISFFPEKYELIFKKFYPKAFLLYELFIKNTTHATEDEICDVIGKNLYNQMLNENIIYSADSAIKSRIRVVPYRGHLYMTDRWDRTIKNFVYFSYDSLSFAKLLKKLVRAKSFERMLDIGCGSGILTIELNKNATHSIGIDLNKRAIDYAYLNAKLNNGTSTGRKIEFYCKNIFDVDEKYDLIISNPPFVFLNEEAKGSYLDSDGGHLGIEFTTKLLGYIPNILKDNGTAIIFCRAPIDDNGKDLLFEKITGLRLRNKLLSIDYTYLSFDRYSRISDIERQFRIHEYRTVAVVQTFSKHSYISRGFDLPSILAHKF